MEDNNISFEDFAAAFDDDGYQTEVEEETAEPANTEQPEDDFDTQEEATPADKEEPEGEAIEETGDDGHDDQPDADQTFTIKVNKEERTVSREEMISLAQKGADYDRVKGQLEESRTASQNLQNQLDKCQGAMEILEMISEQSKMPIEQLVEQMHMQFLMNGGKTEAEARAEIRAAKAEKELSTYKNQQAKQKSAAEDNQARAAKEVAEFRKEFPDVELTEELCDKLQTDIRAGMSLAGAYRKMEYARKDAEIADLQRKLAAEQQNKKNRSNSPGSQTDSGGRRSKSDFDEFMAAFE